MKFSIFYIFVLLLSPIYISTSSGIPAPGDTYSNPIAIVLGDTEGDLPGPSSDGSIWYSIVLAEGSYEFRLEGPVSSNFDFQFYRADRYGGVPKLIFTAERGAYFDTYSITISADTYLINVYNMTSAVGAFTLTVQEPVHGDERSDWIKISKSTGIATGSMPGPASDESIWYGWDLYSTGRTINEYIFSLTGPDATNFDFKVWHYTEIRIVLLATADNTTYPEILFINQTITGLFYINVYDVNNDGGSFELKVSEIGVDEEPDEIPSTSTLPAGYEQVDSTSGYSLYKFSGLNGHTLSLNLTMLQAEFNIAILDTNFYPSVLWALFYEKNGQSNPHLLYDTYTEERNEELNNLTMQYKSSTDELYVLVYSLDVLFGYSIAYNASFKIDTASPYEITEVNTDPSQFFRVSESGYFVNNNDKYWDDKEWNIYKGITIQAGQTFDLFLQSVGEVGLILFDGESIDDINNAIDDVNIHNFLGTPLPANIHAAAAVDGLSYMSFSPDKRIIANLAIFSNDQYNPKNQEYELFISHKPMGGKLREIEPVTVNQNVGGDPYDNYPDTSETGGASISALYLVLGIMTISIFPKKKNC